MTAAGSRLAPGISVLTRTPLGSPPLLLCATPAYLATPRAAANPAQLADHSVLRSLE